METVKTPATIDDLYHVPDDGYTYELIDGELVKMAPTGEVPGTVAFEIAVALRTYAIQRGQGHAHADGVAYTVDLPNRQSFSPDASFTWSYDDTNMKFVHKAPIFAAEVRSEGDYGVRMERQLAAKRQDYFNAGTAVVWDVDPLARTVTKYIAEASETPILFHEGEEADAEPALPGWKAAVAAFFPGAR